MSNILQTYHLTTGYQSSKKSTVVLSNDLNLSLEAGILTCLLGPNGVGKSTLLRTLAGMQAPIDGRILYNSQSLASFSPKQLSKEVAVVLTDDIQSGMMTAYDMVATGRYPYTNWLGNLTEQDEDIIDQVFEQVQATAFKKRYFHTLSDGEKKKILIARALAQQPKVLFLDEPTAFLDLTRKLEILSLLRMLAEEQHMAILLTTHDLHTARSMADVFWLMNGSGEIIAGAPEELILQGAIASTFSHEGFIFEEASSSFTYLPKTRAFVRLKGEGNRLFWTEKALQRIGIQVDNIGETDVMISCNEHNGWQYHKGSLCQDFTTLQALIEFLKKEI